MYDWNSQDATTEGDAMSVDSRYSIDFFLQKNHNSAARSDDNIVLQNKNRQIKFSVIPKLLRLLLDRPRSRWTLLLGTSYRSCSSQM